MEVVNNRVALHLPSQQLLVQESSGEEHEVKAPKKRAETWIQDEIRALIAFRGEMDSLFNTSKSNKHLWEQISVKMKERGFDRSATMCTDKWRNLLKEYKKAKHHDKAGSAKMSCYKDLEELLQQRSKGTPYRSPQKMESYVPYSPKGPSRSSLNLEHRLDQEGHQLALPSADAVVANGMPWAWRDSPANGEHRHMSYEGKVIMIKCGDTTRRIGIDGTAEAIKEAIKSAFGLRTKRGFWLEDEEGVVRSLDREMPTGAYTLHLDDGLTIKLCIHDDNDRLMDTTEDKVFYTEEDFRSFLRRRGWLGLREVGSFQDVESLGELRSLCVYQRSLLRSG